MLVIVTNKTYIGNTSPYLECVGKSIPVEPVVAAAWKVKCIKPFVTSSSSQIHYSHRLEMGVCPIMSMALAGGAVGALITAVGVTTLDVITINDTL